MIAISIIVPIYNVELFLKECLDSILRQSFNNYEVILVNDGSKDSSKEIAMSYVNNDKRFIYYEQGNKGLSAARNTGLKFAQGKYIIFIDSDDFWIGDDLGDIYKQVEEEQLDLLIFSGDKYKFNSQNKLINIIESSRTFASKSFNKGIDMFNWLKNNNAYRTGVYYQIVRHEILNLNEIRFIEKIIHEDHYYTFLVLMNSLKCKYYPIPIYAYRIRSNSIMTTNAIDVKRYFGFSITYNYIVNWCKKNIELAEKNPQILYYLDNIGFIGLKYFLKIYLRRSALDVDHNFFIVNLKSSPFISLKNKIILSFVWLIYRNEKL